MLTLARSRFVAITALVAMLVIACGGAATSTDTVTAPDENSDSGSPAAVAEPEPTPAPTSQPAVTVEESAEPSPEPSQVSEPTPTVVPALPVFVPPTGIVPIRIEIATIGVDAPTIDLSLAGLEPEVPVDFDDTGWYTETRLPGEIGPAIIVGHIDSRSGPAVFADLDKLIPGDEITVYDAANDARTFVVVDAALYPKGDLPDSVFGFGEPEPELRLITCGGTFDADAGHYRDNYVVFARLLDA